MDQTASRGLAEWPEPFVHWNPPLADLIPGDTLQLGPRVDLNSVSV